jgi:DNA topoisomerase-1
VGNEEYARTNHSYGLTTMQDRHVKVWGANVQFAFRGKSGKTHVIALSNRKLAEIVKGCQELPGRELFQYRDKNGNRVDITSGDVNAYLHEVVGGDFTAKDFRTWAGTVLAARALQELGKFASKTEARRNLMEAVKSVAKMLGNTPAICRGSYIHPVILNAYLEGSLVDRLKSKAEQKLVREIRDLRPEEAAVLMLLQNTWKGSHV